MVTRGAARSRRIKYETSKRFCREAINTAVENVPHLILQKISALRIQAAWKDYCLHRAFEKARREELEKQRSIASATRIQGRVRVFLIRRRAEIDGEKRCFLASTTIASQVRRWMSTQYVKRLRQQRLDRLQFYSAVILQSLIRGSLAKKRVQIVKERRAVMNQSEAVLRRFFHRVFAIKAAKRRMLHEMHSIVIQRYAVGFICRRNFVQMKHLVIIIQKLSRGYLCRRSITQQLMKDMCNESFQSELESSDSSSVVMDVQNKEVQLSCESYEDSGYSSPAKTADEEENEALNHQLMLGRSAAVIQSWFRRKPWPIYPPHDKVRIHTAALIITKALIAQIAIKNARLELDALRQQHVAATRIQCRIRIMKAKAKVSTNCAIDFQRRDPTQIHFSSLRR